MTSHAYYSIVWNFLALRASAVCASISDTDNSKTRTATLIRAADIAAMKLAIRLFGYFG
jgi:hypothetical protein